MQRTSADRYDQCSMCHRLRTTELLKKGPNILAVDLLVYVGNIHSPTAALQLFVASRHELFVDRDDGCFTGQHPQLAGAER